MDDVLFTVGSSPPDLPGGSHREPTPDLDTITGNIANSFDPYNQVPQTLSNNDTAIDQLLKGTTDYGDVGHSVSADEIRRLDPSRPGHGRYLPRYNSYVLTDEYEDPDTEMHDVPEPGKPQGLGIFKPTNQRPDNDQEAET
ncbi:hypothetical protein KVT40_006839 [Elsinoe batatas]|uniref:Uncharacterized protein n=1 Tax=Elsinoe batatas TaxID=2601811 RepID=A0A8K0L3F9_9PEZI|nr:hypothetical protein KVT40_006839 [Elsinoe batatas]